MCCLVIISFRHIQRSGDLEKSSQCFSGNKKVFNCKNTAIRTKTKQKNESEINNRFPRQFGKFSSCQRNKLFSNLNNKVFLNQLVGNKNSQEYWTLIRKSRQRVDPERKINDHMIDEFSSKENKTSWVSCGIYFTKLSWLLLKKITFPLSSPTNCKILTHLVSNDSNDMIVVKATRPGRAGFASKGYGFKLESGCPSSE